MFARHTWRSDNALAALSLITAGLGWGWLPRNFARPHVAAGALVEIVFDNLSNGLDLWVDVVWSRERPLGLGAQRFIALIARDKSGAPPVERPARARRPTRRARSAPALSVLITRGARDLLPGCGCACSAAM